MALSEAFVTVLADDSRFTEDARKKLNAALRVVERALKPVKIKVELGAESVRDLQRDLRDVVKVLTRTLSPVTVKVEVDAAGATTAARAKLTADLAVIERKLPPIKLGVGLDPVSVRALQRDLRGIIRLLSRTLDPVTIRVRLEPDDAQIAAQLADLDALRAHIGRTITTHVRIDGNNDAQRGLQTVERNASRLLSGFLGLAKGALSLNLAFLKAAGGAGIVATAISGITVAVSAGAHGLASLTGGVNTFIGAAAGLAVVGITAKIAMIGIGEGFKAVLEGGKPEELAEALKGLAPAARTVVLEFGKALPALRKFQTGIQQATFAKFTGSITQAVAVLPKLQGGFKQVGSELGNSAAKFVDFLTKASSLKNINTILESTAKLIAPVTDKLIVLAGGGLQRAADGSKVMGDRFSAMGAALRKVGQGFKDIGIFFSGFSTAVNSTVAPAVDRLKDAFAGVVLTQDTFRTAGERVGFIVGDLANNFLLLVGVISASVGPSLAIIGPALLSLVNSFAALDRAIVEGAGPALTALAPLFTTLASIIATGALPLLVSIVGAIGAGLTNVINLVLPVIQKFIAQLGPGLAAVAPQAKELIDALFDAVTALIGPVAQNADVLLPRLKKIIAEVGPVMTQVTRVVREFLIPILSRLGGENAALIGILGGVLDVSIALTGVFLKVATKFLDMMAAFKKSAAGRALIGLIDDILGSVNGLIGGLGSAISLVGTLLNKASQIKNIGSSLSFDIPFFAKGGIVGSGTLAVVGEAGPEAIVPLTDPRRALAIAEESGLASLIRQNLGGSPVTVVIGTRDGLLASLIDVRIEGANKSTARRQTQGVRQ